MNILIVDDDENIRALLRTLLTDKGHGALTAADGVAALEVLRGTPVDVIISDMMMPRMDGYRLCQAVRADERLKDIPFIFHSTYTSPADAKLALDLGADLFLHKPASVDALLEALRRVMSQPRAERPGPVSAMSEAEVMQKFSDRLVAKVEEKNLELMGAQEKLILQATALSTAANAILITDHTGKIVWVNPAVTEMTGYSAEEVIGKTPRILKSGQHDTAFYKDFWKTISSGQTWRGEFTNRRKNGSLYYDEHTVTPVRNAAGKITHYIGVQHDVTARKQAERALRESQQQMELLLQSTGEGIYGGDVQGRCTFINRAGAAMLGRRPEEIVGQPMHALVHHHKADGSPYPAEECPLFRAVHEGKGCRADTEVFWRQDGTCFPVECSSHPIREDGVITGAVVAFNDITEKQQLAAQFLRAQRMESIGSLASGIAHDLNNALAPILMSAELLQLTNTDPAKSQILDAICDSAKRGAGMVKQILTFARGSEGERGVVQPKHLVQEMIDLTRHSFPKGIQIRANIAANIWTLLGNPTQLHQILLNLCVNARDAMPAGGTLTLGAENVHLDATAAQLSPDAKPGPHVLLTVKDTGTGMTPEVRARLFEAFFTTKAPGKGTGLGLSTALRITKEHGGFLSVDSELGQGSTFKVYLPAQETTAAAATEAAPPVLPMGNGELILVVDDEVAIRSIATQTLAAYGYQVVTAYNGAHAVGVCAQNLAGLQLLLTDMDMPIMDGPAVIRAIRVLAPRLKVIAASGSGTLADPTALKELDVQGFLHKPYSADDLINTVHEVLQGTPIESEKRGSEARRRDKRQESISAT